MDDTVDELAGVVDLFGGLTRAELERALSEAAFRDGGQSIDDEAFDDALAYALESYQLLRYERDGEAALFVAGPTAFPAVPDAAEDLPHILGIDPRHVDRAALGDRARDRFEGDVDDALEAGDDERARDLLEVSYDLETWAPIDLGDERGRIDAALES